MPDPLQLTLQLEDGSRTIRLEVDVPDGRGPHPLVLVTHGFKGFGRWGFFPHLGRTLAAAGFVTVRINLSGSGVGDDLETLSDDDAFEASTFSRDLVDWRVVQEWATSGGLGEISIDRRAIGLFGHSRGGGTAILHAATRTDVRAVVTWAAISHVRRFDDATVAKWKEDGVLLVPNARTGQTHRMGLAMLDDATENAARLDIAASARRVHVPTLVVHGRADETVSMDEHRALMRWLPNATELVIDGAGHTFGATHPFTEVTPALERAVSATVDHFTRHVARRT